MKQSYKATDPAANYVDCTCGKSDCWTVGLLPLRDHTAALYRAILTLGFEERFAEYDRGDDPWPGVIYGLELSASLEALTADPTYVSEDLSWTMCSAAWETDEESRELASKYAAALISFNFAWMAYEAAIELSVKDEKYGGTLPVRGRQCFKSEAIEATKVASLPVIYRVAKHYCRDLLAVSDELDASITKYELSMPAAAAELARLFRNHIVHGRDPLPVYSEEPCRRLYAVARMLLLLIQHLVLRRLIDPNRHIELSLHNDGVGSEPADVFLRNLHYRDERWRSLTPSVQSRRFP
ncbi:hypothetical protein [uncultured Brevundimonas sp.]|uniref:hypothetical protein n=1 Tax=uncultured Brevundimonas sp. TaxID=213418 RepID=UPI002615B70F|nr:hypothetical protein [uncultured Brevundimonas sp.]